MSETKHSLVVYQSRNQWMNNLLGKLGLISIKDDPEPSEEKAAAATKTIEPKVKPVETTADETAAVVFDSDDAIDAYLKDLDPKHWKEQDHYRVLGLSKRRSNATESEIKKAYRKIVLRHHPDKRGGEVDLDCDYYSCITKANEILSDPVKRRSYDSVDPTFDESVPNATTVNKRKFFEVFAPAFERNVRWSVEKDKQSVPKLGDENSTYDEVNEFYSFWFSFESWREFSYLDEEEKEKGENREERRYLDKQNKVMRTQRKKEEMARIRTLVDNAYQCDPRVARFKEAEKQRRQDLKQAKQAEARARKDEEERLKREAEEREQAQREQQEAEEKKRKEAEKKQKEALKKKTKKEMKLLEAIFVDNNYFAEVGQDAQRLQHMQDMDKLLKMNTLDDIIALRQEFEACSADVAKMTTLFLEKVQAINAKLEAEREKVNASAMGTDDNASSSASASSTKKVWSYDDIQILIKAVKLFPAGTQNRWSVVATYINDKSESGVVRTHRDALEKAKELQQSGDSKNLKEEANKNAFRQLETQAKMPPSQANKKNELTPSQRFDAPSSILEVNDTPWTNDEQQLLEQAMKTYPTSMGTERWNLIAECIPNRSRADCIKRYKALVELVKAKNSAKTKAAATTKK